MGITTSTRNAATDIIPLIIDMTRVVMATPGMDTPGVDTLVVETAIRVMDTVVTGTNPIVPAMAVIAADPDKTEININPGISTSSRDQWRCKSKQDYYWQVFCAELRCRVMRRMNFRFHVQPASW